MEDIKIVQQRIKLKREAYNKTDLVYYNALQQWSLSQEGITSGSGTTATPEDLESKRSDREKALTELNTEINSLTNGGTPREWLGQLPSNLPFLLFPVRLEARYVTIRHVVRNLDIADAIDVSQMPAVLPFFENTGFENDEAGVMTYEVPALTWFSDAFGPLATFMQEIVAGNIKPPGGKFIKRINDNKEIRIRIYPDEVFSEGLERNLQPGEWDAGVQFWQKLCAGNDPQEQWLQLSLAVTAPRAAWIIHVTMPKNFEQGKPLPSTPLFETNKPLKDGAFTCPLKTHLLPDRFVVRLYKGGEFKEFTGKVIPEPLLLGLDPTNDPFNKNPGSSLSDKGTGIQTPDYINWIHNFEAAENAGMAVRIDLDQNPEYQDGIDKIVVLGTKLSVDETDGSELLSRQLEDHLYKENGLSIIPQGTPTNNFGSQKTQFNQREEDAVSYFKSQGQLGPKSPLATDQSILMKALGLGTSLNLPRGDSIDISEASLMNEILWPATWGYYLLQFFSPGLDEKTRELARQFFIQHVSGRGTLPVLRLNRQPYGIILVSSFSDWKNQEEGLSEEEQFASQLWSLFLSKLNQHWKALSANVINVNKVSSQGLDDKFFEMIGISPSSDQLQRQWMVGTQFQEVLLAAGSANPSAPLFNDLSFNPANAENDLVRLGINGEFFRALTGSYHTMQQQVRRVFMDGRPILEEQPLERIALKSWNFLDWLAQSKILDIWSNNFGNAPEGDGSEISSATLSAFAVLARQAVLRTYLETAMHAVESNNGLWLLKVKDFPAQNLHSGTLNIDPANLPPDDKLQQAYKPIIDHFQIDKPFALEPDRRIYFSGKFAATGDLTLADWIETQKKNPSVQPLSNMIEGLEYFSKASAAKLNRLFTEHLDLCSHRLDAWMLGLVNQRLAKQRKATPVGIFLGSFGYLLGLKPNPDVSIIFKEELPEYQPLITDSIRDVAIPIINTDAIKLNGMTSSGSGWERSFFYIGENSFPRVRLNTITGHVEPDEDVNLSQTDGFVHAPSTAHATAAAILRTGYLNHKADDQTALLALQLNSPRVRQALQLLEGMQLGSSLNELLGYYFERKLKENNLNRYLYNLRMAFPVQRTQEPGESPSLLTTIDGLALLKRRRENSIEWPSTVGGIDPNDYSKIDLVTGMVEDYVDSLGDLLLAESVYQSAKGNTVRAAAALRIMNGGGQVVLPDFINTPLKGSGITHRVGVVFEQGANTGGKAWTSNGSPRSMLMPDLNGWLNLQFPKPGTIAVTVTLPGGEKQKVTVADLNIEPIDLIYSFPESFTQGAQSPLGLFIQSTTQQKFTINIPADANGFSIDFKDRSLFGSSDISLFEISSLVLTLRRLINQSRPLTVNDFLLPDKPAAPADKINNSRLKNEITKQVTANTPAALLIESLRKQANAISTSLSQQDNALQSLIKPLFRDLLAAWQQGVDSSASEGIFYLNRESAIRLAAKALDTAKQLENRIAKAGQLITSIAADLNGIPLFERLKEVAEVIYGSNLSIFPDVGLANPAEVKACYAGRQMIENAGPDVIDDWMREASLVRKYLRVYRNSSVLTEILSTGNKLQPLTVLQLPFFGNIKQPWIGNKVPEALPQDQRGTLSLILDLPDSFQPETSFSGFIIDEWPEWIPSRTVDTGVAFQYNQPNTEPPQTMLLAVTPDESENWNWEYLMGAVNDALELSKQRLVTPGTIRGSNSGLSQVLPAILLPFMAGNQQTPVVEPL